MDHLKTRWLLELEAHPYSGNRFAKSVCYAFYDLEDGSFGPTGPLNRRQICSALFSMHLGINSCSAMESAAYDVEALHQKVFIQRISFKLQASPSEQDWMDIIEKLSGAVHAKSLLKDTVWVPSSEKFMTEFHYSSRSKPTQIRDLDAFKELLSGVDSLFEAKDLQRSLTSTGNSSAVQASETLHQTGALAAKSSMRL